jgi:hypothetical protein
VVVFVTSKILKSLFVTKHPLFLVSMTDQEKLERHNLQRKELGLEPVASLPGEPAPQQQQQAPPQQEPQEQPQSQAPPAPKAKTEPTPPATPAAQAEPELNDEIVKRYLEGKGVKVTSFEELLPKPKEPTAEELEQQRQVREARKLSFGIENGYYKKEQYDDFVRATGNPVDLAFASYKEQALAEDSTLTEFEIKEEFEEKFGLNAEKDSRKFKTGQKEIKVMADSILKSKFGKFYEADADFETYDSQKAEEKKRHDKILSLTPTYKADVKKAADKLRKTKNYIRENWDNADEQGFEVEFEYSDQEINKAMNILLDPKFASIQIERGWTEEGIAEIINTALIRNNLPRILSKSAKDFHSSKLLEKNKDRQGVRPQRDLQFKTQSEFNNEKARRLDQLAQELGMPTEARVN